MCGLFFFYVQRTVPCGETYFVQCRSVYCIVSTYFVYRNIYIYTYYIYINVFILLIYSLFLYIYTYRYISFFHRHFPNRHVCTNVEFRDNSFSAPSVGWWLRHGSDSSRSQLRLQPGDPRCLGGRTERKSTSTSTPLLKVVGPKNPIIDGIMGPL